MLLGFFQVIRYFFLLFESLITLLCSVDWISYWIVLVDLQLHLNPVHAVAQLRPSMQYISSDGKKKQAESTEESVGTSKKQVQ